MRCLLDKVTSRYALQGLLKLAENRDLTDEELFTLDLFARASSQNIRLFIPPSTAQVLQKITQLPRYSAIIQLFLDQVEIAFPSHYFKRWTRRLRDCHFTREDAAILALATFGTNTNGTVLSMHVVATYDQPMVNNWFMQQTRIQERFAAMQKDIPMPYSQALLPEVLHPEHIIGANL
jgi:hypothetical protein